MTMFNPFFKTNPFLQKSIPLMLLITLSTFSFIGCENPAADEDAGEQEFITSVRLSLVDRAAKDSLVIVWSDPDGDGVGAFVGNTTIRANRLYQGTIALRNDLATTEKEKDITAEILEEADEHQFFYTFSPSLKPYTQVTITDKDKRGMPIGLKFTVQTGALPSGTTSVSGSLNIVLSHYTTLIKNGSNLGNEEDVNITQNVELRSAN